VPSYTFKYNFCWCEVPGGSLHITGGRNEDDMTVREAVRIDTRREFHISTSSRHLSECERYVSAENRWEALPPLELVIVQVE
jgi:hypothetical protein